MPIKLVNVVARVVNKVVNKDVTTLAGMAVLTACGSSGSLGVKDNFRSLGDTTTPVVTTPPVVIPTPATPAPTPAPTPSAPLASGAQLRLGVNVSNIEYYSGERSFANLVAGSYWLEPSKSGWPAIDPSRLDENNYPKSIAQGEILNLVLSPPESVLNMTGAQVRCTYEGSVDYVIVAGTSTNGKGSKNAFEFYWPGQKLGDQRVWLEVHGNGGAIKNIDCRETTLSRDAVFAPEYLDSLKPYKVLRFLNMDGVNGNGVYRWADRTLPTAASQMGRTGVALEHMVALANANSADAWLNMPWNGDEEYITKMAQLVHDKIGPNQHVYIEMSNEVWNYVFSQTKQAETEGVQEGLSTDKVEAMLRRYAEKTTWAMKIWTKVFEDRPGQLVRVVNNIHTNTWSIETVMKFRDTANWVDAIATAPYFGYDLFTGPLETATDLDILMPALDKKADEAISVFGKQNQAIAKSYGKRYIAYEGGSHAINPGNTTVLAALNRDARLYTIYKKYLAAWRAQMGDVLTLFEATGPIGSWGAWGLREYAGQPLSETPKRRAVVDDAPNWNG